MSLKNLLVHIDDKATCEKRVDAAIALAQGFDAHLAAVMLVAEPHVPPALGVHIPADVLSRQREESAAEAAAVLEAVRQRGDKAGKSIEVRHEWVMLDDFAAAFARQARHYDLSIVGQVDPDEGDVDAELVAEAAFMQSGRPTLMIPYIGARNLPPKRALVAWDGSREAARAVNDALPLLAKTESVTILVVDPGSLKGRVGDQPGADLATHLARHGLTTELVTAASGGLGAGDVIIGQATDIGADLVVMGGYGHSRLRELVLGGATQSMLDHMPVPVLISH
jgi:nucleotide-binding universal stress UspA family protein